MDVCREASSEANRAAGRARQGPGEKWLGEREQELWGGEEDRGLGSVLK